jgi:hypothetical protein
MARKPIWVVILAAFLLSPASAADPWKRAVELGVPLVDAPPLRRAIYPGWAGDVYAHNNVAETPSTWGGWSSFAHEATHGANSIVRNRYGGWDVVNACYLLGNKASVLREPHVTLDAISRNVPSTFRGMSFVEYFVRSQREWGTFTLYIFDEWSAYTNGTWVGIERGSGDWSCTLQMAEFTVYSVAALQATGNDRNTIRGAYNIRPMAGFVAWMIEQRVVPLLKLSKTSNAMYSPDAIASWNRFCTSRASGTLRQSLTNVVGPEWTRATLVVIE